MINLGRERCLEACYGFNTADFSYAKETVCPGFAVKIESQDSCMGG